MPDKLPSDVRAVLTQLFEEGETAIVAGKFETARRTVDTAETVCQHKLPEGERRSRLLHGCDRVAVALDSTGDRQPDTAAEYLRAMSRRVD